MDIWSLSLESDVVRTLYESYLERVAHITTLYSVVALKEQQIVSRPDDLDDALEIPLSTNYGSSATIKTKHDIMHSVESGQLHRINCYQTVVSLVSNFEDLIDRVTSHFAVTRSEIDNATPEGFNGSFDSLILKKIYAIHSKLSIHSNVIGRHETGYYYKIFKVRNCIVHRQGIPNSSESTFLQPWVSDGRIAFDKDQIDDFVHFFLMPLVSMIRELDKRVVADIKQSNS